MFSNLNGVGPPVKLSVPASSGLWSETGLGGPLRWFSGRNSNHSFDTKTLSILLQDVFTLKLDLVCLMFVK